MALYFVFKRQDKIPAPAVIEKKSQKNKTEKSEQNLSLLSINQQTKPQKNPDQTSKTQSNWKSDSTKAKQLNNCLWKS